MIPQYRRTLARCDELLKRATAPTVDGLIVSAVCQHICVLMAGALETAIQEILSRYCANKSHPRIASYSIRRVSRFSNASPEKILEIIKEFDAVWADEIDKFWADGTKDHIGSIVGNRHNIAHGRTSEVSVARLSEWRKSLDLFIDKLVGLVGSP